MAGATLRELSLPRHALRRDEAAASLAVSPSTFDAWVRDGLMPRGKKIGGVVLWSAERIRIAAVAMFDEDEPKNEDEGENPFDSMVV